MLNFKKKSEKDKWSKRDDDVDDDDEEEKQKFSVYF